MRKTILFLMLILLIACAKKSIEQTPVLSGTAEEVQPIQEQSIEEKPRIKVRQKKLKSTDLKSWSFPAFLL